MAVTIRQFSSLPAQGWLCATALLAQSASGTTVAPASQVAQPEPAPRIAAGEVHTGDNRSGSVAGTPEETLEASIAGLRTTLRSVEREGGTAMAGHVQLLRRLAALELAAGESEYAAARLERAITLIRSTSGYYDPALMAPLLELARIYLDAGRFDTAIEKLRYAQHLTHRADGVYSLDQLALIEQLAQAFVGKDEPDEAGREMRLAFDLSRRVHGDENIEHVPGMLRYAAWHRLIGEDRKARRLYHSAIEMIENVYGENHHALIEPLSQLAMTASNPGYYLGERESALLRADQVLNAQAGVDAGDRAASAVRLGDFYTLHGREEDAANAYGRAWQLLAEADSPPVAARVFSDPVVLNFPHAFTPKKHRGIRLEDQVVEVTYEFRVGADGKVSGVQVVEHNGPQVLTRSLRELAFRLNYRPRLEAGRPVATERYRVTESLRIESPVSRALFMEQLRDEIRRLRAMLWVRGRAR